MLRLCILVCVLVAVAAGASAPPDTLLTTRFGQAAPLNPDAPGSAWIDFASALFGVSETCVADLPNLSSVSWGAASPGSTCVPQTFLTLNSTLIDLGDAELDDVLLDLSASWSVSRYGTAGQPYGPGLVADPDADPRLGACGWILTTGWTDPADPLTFTTYAGVFATDTGVYAYTGVRGATNATTERAARRIGSKNALDVMVTGLRVHLGEAPPRVEWMLNTASVFNYTRLGGGIDRADFDLYAGTARPSDAPPASADALTRWSASFVCGLYMADTADLNSEQPDTGLVSSRDSRDACITVYVPMQIPTAAAGSVDDLLFGQGATANLYEARVAVTTDPDLRPLTPPIATKPSTIVVCDFFSGFEQCFVVDSDTLCTLDQEDELDNACPGETICADTPVGNVCKMFEPRPQ